MKPLALDGIVEVKAEPSEGMLHEWRREKQRLEEEILSLRREVDDARSHNEKLERAMRALRQSLTPLHRALRSVFGEIDLAVGEEESVAAVVASGAPPSVPSPARWEHMKQQFPGAPAKIIDALLGQGEMTITQLSNFTRMHYNTAKNAVSQLTKAGAITRDGGICRLRV